MLAVGIATFEELLWRRLVPWFLARSGMSTPEVWLAASLWCGLTHLISPISAPWLAAVLTFFAALGSFTLIRISSSLLPSIVVHAAINLALFHYLFGAFS